MGAAPSVPRLGTRPLRSGPVAAVIDLHEEWQDMLDHGMRIYHWCQVTGIGEFHVSATRDRVRDLSRASSEGVGVQFEADDECRNSQPRKGIEPLLVASDEGNRAPPSLVIGRSGSGPGPSVGDQPIGRAILPQEL